MKGPPPHTHTHTHTHNNVPQLPGKSGKGGRGAQGEEVVMAFLPPPFYAHSLRSYQGKVKREENKVLKSK